MLLCAALSGCALSGCAAGADEIAAESRILTTTPAQSPALYQPHVIGENRLALNRLALNRLALNRLALNRLALDDLPASQLRIADASELIQTEEGRELLRYVVQCALAEGDILVAEHEGTSYELSGLLGLATTWKTQPLSASGQRLLSACLLAHVNAFGVSVPISLRAGAVLPSTLDERQRYSVYEGTFFGQVFKGDELEIYACQGSVSAAAIEHSEDRAVRVCTDDISQCAVESVGRCRDVCELRREDEGWTRCRAHGVLYPETISVFLLATDPDGMNQRCTSPACQLNGAMGAAAMLDCAGMARCITGCPDDATCAIDGARTNNLDVDIGAARFSEIDCYGANNCNVRCSDGASCEVDCVDDNNCKIDCSEDAACDIRCGGPNGNNCNDIQCRSGASCIIHCDGVDNCAFSQCHAGAVTCPGDIIVCGRPCP